ncbi:hypothetical protein J3B02_006453, partial [Coemansia erecta]
NTVAIPSAATVTASVTITESPTLSTSVVQGQIVDVTVTPVVTVVATKDAPSAIVLTVPDEPTVIATADPNTQAQPATVVQNVIMSDSASSTDQDTTVMVIKNVDVTEFVTANV